MRNPSNGEDINTCTILSLSLAASIPYEKADEIGIRAGREKNKGFYLEPLFEEARKKGIRINKIPLSSRMNLKQFISDFPIGRFVLEKKAHAFCVINGIVHDAIKNGNNSIVESAYYFDVKSVDKIKSYFKDNYSN